MQKNEISSLAIELMTRHGLIVKDENESWKFSWSKRKTCWGLCNYKTKTIQLSSFLFTPQVSYRDVKETIIHEIAHALTPYHGHDWIWKKKCRELGGNPERTAQYEGKPEDLYKWGIFYQDEMIKGYHRKPPATVFKQLPTMYLKCDPKTTKGKLTIVEIK